MKRDRRLAVALLLFVLSAVAAVWQSAVVSMWMTAAVMREWDYFAETFGVESPFQPNKACFGYCAADLPFLAGWVAIGGFVIAVGLVAWAWWKPRG
ncbi:MAG: hypothetical protein CL808_06285 [Citromicrobium sp.]|nr:hypothetical protein [Citromicrobium sp.]